MARSGGTPGNIVPPTPQKLAKPPVTVPPVNATPIYAFAAVVAPSIKVNQVACDPWAEVDTWLGYGEDLGEDWRGLLAEDLSAENLAAAGSTFYKNDEQNGTDGGNQQDAEAAPTTMTVLSTSGGEFSSSPKQEIMDVSRGQAVSNCVDFTQLMEKQVNLELKDSDTDFTAFQSPADDFVPTFGRACSRFRFGLRCHTGHSRC